MPDIAVFRWQNIPLIGWFIDPDDRSILTFLPGQQPELQQGSDSLPVLAGIALEMTAADVFNRLQLGTPDILE